MSCAIQFSERVEILFIICNDCLLNCSCCLLSASRKGEKSIVCCCDMFGLTVLLVVPDWLFEIKSTFANPPRFGVIGNVYRFTFVVCYSLFLGRLQPDIPKEQSLAGCERLRGDNSLIAHFLR